MKNNIDNYPDNAIKSYLRIETPKINDAPYYELDTSKNLITAREIENELVKGRMYFGKNKYKNKITLSNKQNLNSSSTDKSSMNSFSSLRKS